ncbi:hypothetical protein T484DRAFT_1808498 [Baffinella frigidus]|nr:hypothetical protein T484DRAFT_1808498 [Cryptophyta sp. CCMP2293]
MGVLTRAFLATVLAFVLAVLLLPDPELGLTELDLSSLSVPDVDPAAVAAEVAHTHGAAPVCSDEAILQNKFQCPTMVGVRRK